MVYEMKMPPIGGETIISATIGQWLKGEGDEVTEGEPILVAESAKLVDEIGAPVSGRLVKLLCEPGDEVAIGQAIAILDVGDAVIEEDGKASPQAEIKSSYATRGRVAASPIARRLAAEHKIDLAGITGSGPKNRITEEDVRKVIEARGKECKPKVECASCGADKMASEILPLTPMRQTIAERMSLSNREAVHVTVTSRVILDSLLDLKDRLNAEMKAANSDLKIGLTDFFVKATALTLKDHPRFNASLCPEGIKMHPQIDMGVAMALEEGLITVVVKGCENRSVFEIAKDMAALKTKVRESCYEMEDITGSTFTISNLGMYGVSSFTPIINPGEAAILGFGCSTETVLREDNERGFAVKRVMNLSLSFDHRVTDGAPAAKFLRSLSAYLENPYSLLVSS